MVNNYFSDSLSQIIRSFSEDFNEKIREFNCEQIVDLQFCGKGRINYVWFKNAAILTFEGIFTKEIRIDLLKKEKDRVFFVFCQKGAASYYVNGLSHVLTSFKCVVDPSSKDNRHSIVIQAGKKIRLCLIETKFRIFDDYVKFSRGEIIPAPLKDQYIIGYYSLYTQDAITQLFENEFMGMLRRTFILSKIMEIFSFRFSEILNSFDNDPNIIDDKDVSYVIEAKQILRKNLKNPPTIKELAKQVGVNENKLKMGFKRLYNTTINSYVTDERLKKAQSMLAERKFIIKEISSEIGYSNPSYFAKVFKIKFGIAPKIYLNLHKS